MNLTTNDIYLYYKYPKIAKKNINSTKNLLKIEIVKIGVEVQYMLAQTNKCREPIYIENLLCQLLI